MSSDTCTTISGWKLLENHCQNAMNWVLEKAYWVENTIHKVDKVARDYFNNSYHWEGNYEVMYTDSLGHPSKDYLFFSSPILLHFL